MGFLITKFRIIQYNLEEVIKMTYITTAERIGLKIGMALGIKQGIEKQRIIIAQRLLAECKEPDFIAKITDLTLTQIQEIQEELS